MSTPISKERVKETLGKPGQQRFGLALLSYVHTGRDTDRVNYKGGFSQGTVRPTRERGSSKKGYRL